MGCNPFFSRKMDRPPPFLAPALAPNPAPPLPQHSCSFTKPGKVWAGTAPGCQSARRGRPCSESAPRKEMQSGL